MPNAPSAFDTMLSQTEQRLEVSFPATFLAFAALHGGHGYEHDQSPPETVGLWLPLDAVGTALDFDLADFPAVAHLDDLDLERLIVVRLNEDASVFGVLDYRHDVVPSFLLVSADEDDLDVDALSFDTFDAFQQACTLDPDWARAFLAHDAALAQRMLATELVG